MLPGSGVWYGWRTEVSRTVVFVAVQGGQLFLLPNTWTAHYRVSLTVPGPWIGMSLEQ